MTTDQPSVTLTDAQKKALETLVVAQVKRLVANFSELQLLEYRRLVRLELGLRDEKQTVN